MRLTCNIALRGTCSTRRGQGIPTQSHSSSKATAGPNSGVSTLQNAGSGVCLLRSCISDTGPGGADAAGLGPLPGAARCFVELRGWVLQLHGVGVERCRVTPPPPPCCSVYPQPFPQVPLCCAARARPVVPAHFLPSIALRFGVGATSYPVSARSPGFRRTVPVPRRFECLN